MAAARSRVVGSARIRQFADKVVGFDHEHDPVVSSIHETNPTGNYEVQVVGVARIPQQLTGLGSDHIADRLQQPSTLIVKLGPRLNLDLIRSSRRVAGPLVWRWASAHRAASGDVWL